MRTILNKENELEEYKKLLLIWEKNPFYFIERSSILFQRKKQLFAIFGSTAYDVTPLKIEAEGKKLTFRPAMIDGEYIHVGVTEGRCPGIVGYYSFNGGEEYLTAFPVGWIYASELNKSTTEIEENTARMLDDGTIRIL